MGDEALWIVLPPLGWLLWALGGTTWKGWRRFAYPVALGACLLLYGVTFWRSVGTSVAVGVTASLGYGEGKTWLRRTLVGASYGAALLLLKPLWWLPPATALWFVGHMALSRRFNSYPWKIVEGSTGLVQAVLAVWCVTR